ncbi:MAG: hypothetical protein QGI68_02110 [Pseudomonadales bacterium]|jgi:ASC-1-like (ASCH) protein|nr:hypothetical protein [Pseudomonadales bacterium]MDP7360588.1 hypothetical protein [Pseudomonadales bacterium]MDP7594346.1 hypothetical protein [Pseudomonadales bacterium]HJN50531.1 hypothetical protein [Pseudomonadales bacterium]|tara:strand:+ start:10012 stop:10308 length:297 start_codon:yes stop_codon:yes gene_type:complete
MQFTKKLRERVKSGDVTTSVRIWKRPHVKSGGRYTLDEGHIVVTSIHEISFEDISEQMAKESGFKNILDLMKTAQHGSGSVIYFVRFYYEPLCQQARH